MVGAFQHDQRSQESISHTLHTLEKNSMRMLECQESIPHTLAPWYVGASRELAEVYLGKVQQSAMIKKSTSRTFGSFFPGTIKCTLCMLCCLLIVLTPFELDQVDV